MGIFYMILGSEMTKVRRNAFWGIRIKWSMYNDETWAESNSFGGKGLSIWDEEEYRKMQGTWPVISLRFAGIKSTNFQDARDGIVKVIANIRLTCENSRWKT